MHFPRVQEPFPDVLWPKMYGKPHEKAQLTSGTPSALASQRVFEQGVSPSKAEAQFTCRGPLRKRFALRFQGVSPLKTPNFGGETSAKGFKEHA